MKRRIRYFCHLSHLAQSNTNKIRIFKSYENISFKNTIFINSFLKSCILFSLLGNNQEINRFFKLQIN
jgi:hypothetical protein